MAQSVGLAVLAFRPHPSLVALYLIALGGGILLAFDNPLRRSFVPRWWTRTTSRMPWCCTARS